MVVKTGTSDYELLEMIGDRDDPFSEEAFGEFHRRHKDFVFGSCYNFFKEWPPDEARTRASDLSQDTFLKVLKKSSGFKRKLGISADRIVVHVRSWLYKIIRNSFYDQYIKQPQRRIKIVSIDEEQRSKAEEKLFNDSDEGGELSDARLEMYRAIQKVILEISVSEKQKDILKVYVQSGIFDERGNWNLPETRMEELVERHGIGRNAIIQSKNRLIKRIKDQLQLTNL
ncbi:sigma-70 family RNA polymerase sigma factor [Flagellimonas sp. HMM57]|uniref:RNA polymerase sigma factor n=1 Tax=unclassified Flagellimonas TaxID=2644544 RepID=UPI0013D7AFCF|nr:MULTISPECIES: sigma-70 family RNA polymerase sigma factor [unclassified Flagellimonas]UII77145.1 sigma-70 family RNA polymerase sigma factor [Flagellimonas sp. HMM57]